MPNGGWVALTVLIPNLLWLIFPPKDAAPSGSEGPSRRSVLQPLEAVARAAVFAVPFFYSVGPLDVLTALAFAFMGISLAVYYLGWIRYFLGGRRYRHLWMPLAGIPVPLAVAPTVYFLCASVALGSWPLAAASILLAFTHIPLSLRESHR